MGELTAHTSFSDQPHPFRARVPGFTDDDVVVHGDSERGRDIDRG